MKTENWVRNLVRGGLIAALYTALTIFLAPLSYGPIQCRVAEAFTVLPVFSIAPIWGLTVGCLLSNIYAVMNGAALAGVWDILFGSLTTLAAALLSYRFRRVRFKGLPLLSMMFPVVLNALVVGAEITLVSLGHLDPAWFMLNALSVGAGQLVACVGGGILVFKAVDKTRLFND